MQFQVERNVVINAGIDDVIPHLSDFNRWRAWSPWSVIEPDYPSQINGEVSMPGSSMAWQGEIIGSGEITLEKVAPTQLDYDLQFIAPWKSRAKTRFNFKDLGGQTEVIWSMKSSLPFFLFFMVATIKSMVGMDYDRGLAMLKEVIETGKVDADTSDQGVVDFSGFRYVGLPNTSHLSKMPEEMDADFGKLMALISEAGAEPEHMLTVYTKVKLSKQLFSYISAVSERGTEAVNFGDEFVRGEVPAQKMLEIRHRGSYKHLGNAWGMGELTLRAKKIKQNGKPFEYYHNSPEDTPESELLTSIYFPVKV